MFLRLMDMQYLSYLKTCKNAKKSFSLIKNKQKENTSRTLQVRIASSVYQVIIVNDRDFLDL